MLDHRVAVDGENWRERERHGGIKLVLPWLGRRTYFV